MVASVLLALTGAAAPPAPLANAFWNTPCSSVACWLVSLPLDTSPAIKLSIFDFKSPGDEFVVLVVLLVLPLCSEEVISVSADDSAP